MLSRGIVVTVAVAPCSRLIGTRELYGSIVQISLSLLSVLNPKWFTSCLEFAGLWARYAEGFECRFDRVHRLCQLAPETLRSCVAGGGVAAGSPCFPHPGCPTWKETACVDC